MHPIRWIAVPLLVLVALLAALVGLANWIAPDGARPGVDRSRLVDLPDGRRATIGELLARIEARRSVPDAPPTRRAQPTPVDPPARAPGPRVDARALPGASPAELREWLSRRAAEPPADDDLYGLAEYHRARGDLDQALSLYLAVPRDDDSWARARRRIGWSIHAQRGEPGLGVAFVNESLRADPLDGNGWQDAARVYLHTLGIEVD